MPFSQQCLVASEEIKFVNLELVHDEMDDRSGDVLTTTVER